MKSFAVLALAFIFSVSCLAAAPASSPEDTIGAFYTYRIKKGLSGAPTAAELAVLRQWFTPALCAQLEKAGKERDVFIKKYGNSEKPPWIEGDLYSSTFEGPTAFEIAGGAGDGKSSLVQVIFSYRQPG